jgi:hypothetical protein
MTLREAIQIIMKGTIWNLDSRKTTLQKLKQFEVATRIVHEHPIVVWFLKLFRFL